MPQVEMAAARARQVWHDNDRADSRDIAELKAVDTTRRRAATMRVGRANTKKPRRTEAMAEASLHDAHGLLKELLGNLIEARRLGCWDSGLRV